MRFCIIICFSAPLGYFGFETDAQKSILESREFLTQNGFTTEKPASDNDSQLSAISNFTQNLSTDAFMKQYLTAQGNLMKFVPYLDFDLKSSEPKILSKLSKIPEILITVANGEGELFLWSLIGQEKTEKLLNDDFELYKLTIRSMFSRFLPENSRLEENLTKITEFYRERRVPFSKIKSTHFHSLSQALGDFLIDYPVLKFAQYLLKLNPEININFKVHDYVSKRHKARYFNENCIPDYLNCSHGFEMPSMFNFLPKEGDESCIDQIVSLKTTRLIGGVMKDEINEDYLGQAVKLNEQTKLPEIRVKNLNISSLKLNKFELDDENEEKGDDCDASDAIFYKQDVIQFWDEICAIEY